MPDITRGCGSAGFPSHQGQIGDGNDLDAWGYGIGDIRTPDEIQGLDRSVAAMLELMKVHGPFVGAAGFSCNAAITALLASLLEGSNKREASWGSETVSSYRLSHT